MNWRRIIKNHPIGYRGLGLLVLLGLVLAAPPSFAQEWSSPIIIPAVDFENTGVFPTADSYQNSGSYFTGSGATVFTMVAGVYLPHLATITRIEAALYDLGSCGGLDQPIVELMSYSLSSVDATTEHAEVLGGDDPNMDIYHDDSIVSPVVDNLGRGYYVKATLCGPFQAFQGVRIFFTEVGP